MNISDAIKIRIVDLLNEYEMSAYKLSFLAGISPSVVNDCLSGRVKEPTVTTIIHICDAFGISLKDFFKADVFKDVEAIDRFE